MKIKITILYTWLLCLGLLSCNKKDFLDARPNSNIFIPTSLDDCQELLDNDPIMSVTPSLGELSADNYYLNYSFWQLLNTKEQNAYIWAPDIYKGVGNVPDWNGPYQQVLYANVVLDALKQLTATPANQQQWNNLEGAALFMRAYAFYNLAQVFALPYDATTKDSLGIPLKLTPNVDEIIKRATVEETYSQIITDLKQARDLLQDDVPFSNRNRPSKPAALAMLARVFLSMHQYDNAMAYADSSLRMYATLMDFNTKDTTSQRAFDRFNAETLYQSKFVETSVLKAGAATKDVLVDTLLYRSYSTNDLRRLVFYNTTVVNNTIITNLKGSYNGTIFGFTGLATDETYLIRAEGRARSGDVTGALSDLNTLLVQRFKTGTFVPYTATTSSQALALVLAERRKELAFRGLRWTDLRRFNLEGIGYTLQRNINNQVYVLAVNSPLYVLPIPQDVITFNHILQNPR